MLHKSFKPLIGSLVLIETFYTRAGYGRWIEQEIWRVIGDDPKTGVTVEREPSGSGHVMELGLDPFGSAATDRVFNVNGKDVQPDYALYRQMLID